MHVDKVVFTVIHIYPNLDPQCLLTDVLKPFQNRLSSISMILNHIAFTAFNPDTDHPLTILVISMGKTQVK